ncbi:MAG: D-amino acid aminotransferase [Burkholderiales bacterium]
MTETICFLNGEFLPLSQAKISVLDRGFIFGDAVYEVIPVYRRKPFRIANHLQRLQHSLSAIRINNPYHADAWSQLIVDLIARNATDDQSLYIQVTRGAAKRDFGLPQGLTPTVFMTSNPLSTPSQEQIQNGVRAVTLTDIRWLRNNIKSTSLLAANMLRQLAMDAGGAECVLLRDGYLTEGSSSNIFVVKGETLLAPPKDHLILPGITYEVVLELAVEQSVTTKVREIHELEVKSADELLLTSSTREVLAITQLDGKAIGHGKPGPVFRRLHRAFQDYKLTWQ